MRERLTTLACALGALLVFATLFIRTGAPGERDTSVPTTTEHRSNGLLGAMTWLQEESFRALSLQNRFGTLAQRRDIAPTGNLLIVVLPAATAFRTDETVALDEWIRAGNTLLILAALSDRPDWARTGRGFDSDLQLLSGLEPQTTQGPADGLAGKQTGSAQQRGGSTQSAKPGIAPGKTSVERLAAETLEYAVPRRSTLVPNLPHAYLNGVRAAVAFSDYPPLGWTAQVPRDGFILSLAHDTETGKGVLWLRAEGAGTILVSGFASLFSNRALGVADNARLLANIVAASVAPGGAVIFDDEHQGLSAAYDPAKFYKDRRLYATIAIIAAVWLVWVLGGTRLQAPSVHIPAPRETQLVRDTGMFLARVLRPSAAARRLFENFFLSIRAPQRHGGAEHAPLWAWLEHNPRLARADVVQLKAWYADAYSDQRVPLVRLRNLIVRTERQLTA